MKAYLKKNKKMIISNKDFNILKLKLRSNNITCEKCKKIRALQIHHKDRNRKNNHISNLKILCRVCHRKEHYRIKTKIGYGLEFLKKEECLECLKMKRVNFILDFKRNLCSECHRLKRGLSY